MKNRIFKFVAVAALLCVVAARAQPPQAFNYQAVVRDNAGAPVKSRAVGVRIRLHQDSATGAQVYSETHAPVSNNFGNINLAIGKGAASGVFSSIDWSRFIFVEIGVDVNGGTAYVDLGTSQLMSVPYALFAGKSVQMPQTLSLRGDTILLSAGEAASSSRSPRSVKSPTQTETPRC